MKVAIYSALLLLVIGVSHVSSQKCHAKELDLCMAMLVFHFQSNGVPADDETVTEWCEVGTEVKECGGNFTTKCMTPLQREILQLFFGGTAAAEKEFCTPGSELRTNYLKHAACVAEGSGSEEFKIHVKDAQAALEATFDADFKDRVPTVCCGYQRLLKACEERTRRMCGDDAVEMAHFVLDLIFSDLPKTICRSFKPESPTCLKILPPSGTQPKGAQSKHNFPKVLDTLVANL